MNVSALNKAAKTKNFKLCLLSGASAAMLTLLAPIQTLALDSGALPSGGVVVSGAATMDYTTPSELHIHQSTDRTVIDWNRFDIGKDSLTQFHQPSSSSLAVNRVKGDGDPTQILGRLQANGNVMVLDKNGVIFDADSRVDVGGIITSTGNVSNQNIMDGGNIQIDGIGPDGFIVNNGTISVKDAGLAAFVAPNVLNNGIIEAKLGRIDIGAGSKATIDLHGDGLIELELSKGVQQTLINNGILHADGGTIQIKAAAAKDIVSNVINNSGIIAADTIGTNAKGQIVLYAQGTNKTDTKGGSVTINDGYISAAGYADQQTGGDIDILGDVVLLNDDSLIDASGDAGGGNIKIGGDYLGTGDTPTALYTAVDPNALIMNDAITNGDGGRTIIWSDDTTEFHGLIYARGGAQSGNGGFVETSGKINLAANGYVDLTAPNGNKGTYLLDPADITIYGNFAPNFVSSDNTLDLASLLELWLDASSLTGLSNGDAIALWQDLSANTNNAVQAGGNKPIFIQNGLNGKSVVRFSGSQMMETLVSSGLTGNSARYLSVLMNSTNGGNNNITGFGADGSGNVFDFMVYNNSIIGHFYGGGYDTIGGSPTYTAGTWANVAMAYDSSLLSVYKNGAFGNSRALALNTINSKVRIGAGAYSGFSSFQGDIAEVFLYSDDLSTAIRGLLDQYQSAKWGIGFLSTNPATEASMAMDATTGYGSFTTRYLERLSNTADIALQATNSITLDFKGDTLNLANDRSITLTTSTGDIKTASTGGITTNRTGSGGNIIFDAGDDIAFNHAFTLNAQNGGQIQFNAGDGVSAPGTLTVTNGNLDIDTQIITGTYTGKNANFDSNTGTINATVSFDNLDIDGTGATLLGGSIGAPGTPTQTMANLIKIAGVSGTGNANYKFAGFNIGFISPPAKAASPAVMAKIASVIQQSSQISGTDKPAAEKDEISIEDGQLTNEEGNGKVQTADCLLSMQNVGCVVK